jgi:hypothetical protein
MVVIVWRFVITISLNAKNLPIRIQSLSAVEGVRVPIHISPGVNEAITKCVDENIIHFVFPGVCSYGSVFVKYT